MRLEPAPLAGAHLIHPDRLADDRGFFARVWCAAELAAMGLDSGLSQMSISFNRVKGTLRGMHFQSEGRSETKIIRCTMGAIQDVIIDLRRESATFCQWFSTELTAENRVLIYVPKGFAHGFLTLTDDAEIQYQMSEPFAPAHAAGVRWDDPVFDIQWNSRPVAISERDASYPDFCR